ncbi:hypothetical protein J8L98_19950 [Pseudoalteromonas sp. MMG013]|uniref:Uncharacterized protein n=1 Tax=Pseudoalteromonas aurantia 208 TaxID=1314867 RepID=A0ABR9EI14_9GAMM|nr:MULTISPECIES: hypothetical protein [Pseudoalteromonas]MBE0370462.1 hypothetical protein [Pseudoalteromonas aurantia 208]MBQ4845076.1 hypothetical protein [Pseudoalteromonas sp. MMG005]MBQ4863965.1 hypothetical protein [Pseudoalteromonas sp. MMG013]
MKLLSKILTLLACTSCTTLAVTADDVLEARSNDYASASSTCDQLGSILGPGRKVVIVMQNNNCYVPGFTAGPEVAELYNSVRDVVKPQINLIEHNFKETITQYVYNASAQADASVKSITARVEGSIHMKIDGVVSSNGTVPVTLNNFDIHGIGKMKKYQLGMGISIYLHVKYENVSLKGHYNVNTHTITIQNNLSHFRPRVYTDVKLPFFLRILDKLTPPIIEKINREFNRIVIDTFEFLGVDMSRKVPQAIQHVAQTIPQSIVPIKSLNNRRVGERVKYTMIMDHENFEIRDERNWIKLGLISIRF